MKLSSYLVATSQVESQPNGAQLVFHSVTGAVALLDFKTWDALQSEETRTELPQHIIEAAKKAGYLVPNEADELEAILRQNKLAGDDGSRWFQVIMPSGACQLACNENACGAYCGQSHSASLLSCADQDRIVKRLESNLRVKSYTEVEVGWFGGEPLLGLSVIERLTPRLISTASAAGATYRARMVTNGVKLSHTLARRLILELGLKAIEVTLDGDAPFHDLRRCTKDKHLPTFETIFSNLKNVACDPQLNGCAVKVRCNVDKRNVSGVRPLLERIASLNIQKRISFYVAAVHPWGNDIERNALTAEEFAGFEINIFKAMLSMGFDVDLLPKRKKITCAATDPHAEVVDPSGNIHQCTETPLVKTYEVPSLKTKKTLKILDSKSSARSINKYSLGTLAGESYPDNLGESLGQFAEKVRAGTYKCHSCNMLPVCGGRCPLNWSLGYVPCPTPKYNIASRLRLWYDQKHATPI